MIKDGRPSHFGFYWVTKDHTVHKVCDLSNSHIKNILKYQLNRNKPILTPMAEEVKKRFGAAFLAHWLLQGGEVRR